MAHLWSISATNDLRREYLMPYEGELRKRKPDAARNQNRKAEYVAGSCTLRKQKSWAGIDAASLFAMGLESWAGHNFSWALRHRSNFWTSIMWSSTRSAASALHFWLWCKEQYMCLTDIALGICIAKVWILGMESGARQKLFVWTYKSIK